MSATIITCVSKPEIYDECVISSVNRCRSAYDVSFLPVINCNSIYSASNAINTAIRASNTDINIIAHQDIKLLGDWFGKMYKVINSLPDDWAILGCAGISAEFTRKDVGMWGGSAIDRKLIVGTVYDKDTRKPYWDGSKAPTKVHCIDECLFILRKSKMLKCDPHLNGFHFYGVDLCLQARSCGYGVYAASLPIIHYGKYSNSIISDNRYWRYLHKTYTKWRKQYPEVLGTHFHWSQDELTSYIQSDLIAEDGNEVTIKAASMSKFQTK